MSNTKINNVLDKALNRAIGGGITGASAMVMNVSTLMWLRTTMNYQYRNGGTTYSTIAKLYKEGGLRRFYRGYIPALTIGPLSRFGDTACNTYAMTRMENSNIPIFFKTIIGSISASIFRVTLMPLDALKTSLQVNGKDGVNILKNKLNKSGYRTLYNGTTASVFATFVGHYPWFLTYNILDKNLPDQNELVPKLIRNGFIGFNAAVISDCCSNSLRVIKTTKQTHKKNINYKETINLIVKKDGIKGILGRGLKTRILTNGLQGLLFTIYWKYLQELYFT